MNAICNRFREATSQKITEHPESAAAASLMKEQVRQYL